MKIIYSSCFWRLYKKCPNHVQKLFQEKEKIFLIDPFHPVLKTHKLHGALKKYWAFSITPDYRVILKIEKEEIYLFYKIGSHTVYK